MAEVVEADAAEVGLAEERGEGAGEVGRVDRSALRGGEHVPVLLPCGARGLTLVVLLLVVELQRLDAAGGEGDAALGGPGLGGQRGEAACAGSLEGSADCRGARVEVEVFPAQAEEFALAEAGVECQVEERVETVVFGCLEELSGLDGRERLGELGAGCARGDVPGDVAEEFILADGVLERGLQDGVDVADSQG
ncbi:hypothetical protein GCM10010293_01550 [Streptomyces griseoflavus]|nr:hypothetical protein GCM10010293_01550 [Streptomyces griseoflavus]